ncbi:MAG TPA: sugar nucleotide-binding protein [Microlunatus sp.]
MTSGRFPHVRILVVGGSGLLGTEVARQARDAGDRVVVTYRTRRPSTVDAEHHQLDLRDQQRTRLLLAELQPELIINAAYQQHDWASTAVGPVSLAQAIPDRSTRLVHVSSDAVFSGKDVHYDEAATPDPITPYGAAKAAAETAITAIYPSAVIARTSLIIGTRDSPQERLVHSLATGKQLGVLFTDDVRCPVHVHDLASALLELGRSDQTGIHNVAGADAITRYDMGLLIAIRDGLDPQAIRPGLRAEANLPGPSDIRLDSARTQDLLRTRLRGATEFLSL